MSRSTLCLAWVSCTGQIALSFVVAVVAFKLGQIMQQRVETLGDCSGDGD